MTNDASPASAPAPAHGIGEHTVLRIGAEVLGTDGVCGELMRVIIDPVAQALTHLVVAPKHHAALGRLVSVLLIEADGDPIRLRCSRAEFHELDEAEDLRFLRASTPGWGYGLDQVRLWPYYALGYGGIGIGRLTRLILSDHVPAGEVQVRRGDRVHASDGWIGSVQGLVIDPKARQMTHVLLQEGHLWGRRQVAIPIGAASRVDNEIHVGLTKKQVEDLPPINLSSNP